MVLIDTCCFDRHPKVRADVVAYARRLRARSPPPVLVALDWADDPFNIWTELPADVYLKRSRVDRRRRRFVKYQREVLPLYYPLKQAMLRHIASEQDAVPRARRARTLDVSCLLRAEISSPATNSTDRLRDACNLFLRTQRSSNRQARSLQHHHPQLQMPDACK